MVSFQEIIATQTVNQIQDISHHKQKELRDLETKLRILVGEKYTDLLAVADEIISMDNDVKQEAANLLSVCIDDSFKLKSIVNVPVDRAEKLTLNATSPSLLHLISKNKFLNWKLKPDFSNLNEFQVPEGMELGDKIVQLQEAIEKYISEHTTVESLRALHAFMQRFELNKRSLLDKLTLHFTFDEITDIFPGDFDQEFIVKYDTDLLTKLQELKRWNDSEEKQDLYSLSQQHGMDIWLKDVEFLSLGLHNPERQQLSHMLDTIMEDKRVLKKLNHPNNKDVILPQTQDPLFSKYLDGIREKLANM